MVNRRHQIKLLPVNGPDQSLDPFRSDALQIGRDDGAGLGAQEVGRRQDDAQGAALSVHRPVRFRDPMRGAERGRGKQRAEIPDGGILDDSGVPSLDPPSGLIRAVRSRGKYFTSPTCTAFSTCSMVPRLLRVGTPTRISTSPTAVSWRMNSSERKLSSANVAPPEFPRGTVTCWRLRNVAAGTSKIDTDPKLKGKAIRRCAERDFLQTSQWE